MPGAATESERVRPRIRSRLWGAVPGVVPVASVVIWVSKLEKAPVTDPSPPTAVQP
jgi:hypothetical protein